MLEQLQNEIRELSRRQMSAIDDLAQCQKNLDDISDLLVIKVNQKLEIEKLARKDSITPCKTPPTVLE